MLGELASAEIERLLETEWVARLGCHVSGRTYVVPITYAYAQGALIAHSAAGLKLDMLRANPRICVEIEHVDDLANWRSVIAWGEFEELRADEAERALDRFLARLVPLTVGAASLPLRGGDVSTAARRVAGAPTFVYRIRLTEKTGRFERAA